MSQLIRSFVAIDLPDTLRYQIKEYILSLAALVKGVRWVNPDNLHLTLKFIGERTSETTEQALLSLTQAASAFSSFQITINGFGGFPNLYRPKVLWLGSVAQPEPALNQLQNKIEAALSEIGIERDTRPFRPHLTLGRIKFKEDFSQLRAFVEAHPFLPVTFTVNSYVMIRSILQKQGAEYRILQKYSLRNPK